MWWRRSGTGNSVYPVASIDEGIEILTGVKSGERDAEGRFPAGTINRLVEDKLAVFRGARPQLFPRVGVRHPGGREGYPMIAHVASSGVRTAAGRPAALGARTLSAIALSAAIRIAQAFQSENRKPPFVENQRPLDCTSFGFVRGVSLTGRWSRTVSREEMAFGLRLAAE